jgi:hypothetical protein
VKSEVLPREASGDDDLRCGCMVSKTFVGAGPAHPREARFTGEENRGWQLRSIEDGGAAHRKDLACAIEGWKDLTEESVLNWSHCGNRKIKILLGLKRPKPTVSS